MMLVTGFCVVTLPAVMIQSGLCILNDRAARRFPNLYFLTVSKLLGIKLTVVGKPLSGGAGVWVSNHVSWLDIVVLGAVRPVTFVAKTEVSKWPVFGLMARVGRTLFIDRDRRQQAGLVKALIEQRLEAGETIVLFAEGTSSDGNRVLPLKSALLGATEFCPGDSPVAVQPVSLALTHCHGIPMGRAGRPNFAWYGDMGLLPHLWNAAKKGPIDVRIHFHKPVAADDVGGRKALARYCGNVIAASLADSLHPRAAPVDQLTPMAKPV